MTLDIAHKSFIVNRASGNQVITGMGISGKAFIFYGVGSSGNTLATRGNDYFLSIGFAEVMSSGNSVITQRYNAIRDVDAAGVAGAFRQHGSSGIIVYTTSGQFFPPNRRGHLVSVGGDGFTINWTNIPITAATTSGYVHVDIFGGSDIVNAKVGNFTAQSGHGTQSVSGIGFEGNLVFFASSRLPSSVFNFLSGSTVAHLAFGMAGRTTGSPSDNGTTVLSEHGGTNADTWRTQRATRSILLVNDAGAVVSQAQVTAFNNDGFDIDWTSGAAGSFEINYLVMKISGQVDVGSFNLVSGTGAMSISGVGFSGKYVQLLSYNMRGGTTSIQANNRISIGSATSGSQRGCIWCGSEDAAPTMITARDHNDSSILVMADEVAIGANSVVMFDADFDNFHSDGFQLDVVTNPFSGDFSGAAIGYVVIGDTPPAPVAEGVEYPKSLKVGSSQLNNYNFGLGEGGLSINNAPPVFGMGMNNNPMLNVSGRLY